MREETHTHLKYDYQKALYPYKYITGPLKALSSRDLGLLQDNIHQRSGLVTTDMVCIGITLQEKMEYKGS